MNINIEPYKIDKDPKNQVTSPDILKKNQRKVSEDYKYDENGLFSKKIFGNIKHCECGELKTPGFCKLCNTRVVDPKNMPDFFIDLGVQVPKLFSDYGKFKDVEKLLTYEAFLYIDENGEYSIIENSIDDDLTLYDPENAKIGVEAAKILHDDIDEWLDKYMVDYISVPHPVFRPNLLGEDGKVIYSSVTKILVELLEEIKNLSEYKNIFDNEENIESYSIDMLCFYNEIYNHYKTFSKEIFRLFCDGKKSFIGSDIRSHRVTGAVKGTIVNRFDVDEDIVLIGDTFIQTLYPNLYKELNRDMEAINDYFVDHESRVLLNRPPTIGHLSILGMKPRVASCYKIGTFKDGALGKNKKSEYDEENDTIGIRTLGINPIITDGMGGDYDGDVLLLIALYGKKAIKEADSMLPSKNFMSYANGEIRNKTPEDIEYVNR